MQLGILEDTFYALGFCAALPFTAKTECQISANFKKKTVVQQCTILLFIMNFESAAAAGRNLYSI